MVANYLKLLNSIAKFRLVSLEEGRYDLNISFGSLKDDLKQMRTRVNDLMGKKKSTKVNVRK
jgi:hypothetical protein